MLHCGVRVGPVRLNYSKNRVTCEVLSFLLVTYRYSYPSSDTNLGMFDSHSKLDPHWTRQFVL